MPGPAADPAISNTTDGWLCLVRDELVGLRADLAAQAQPPPVRPLAKAKGKTEVTGQ